MVFAASFPSWCRSDGFPLSFRHFVHGMAYLGRASLRAGLERVESYRLAQASHDDFQSYQRDVQRMTEVPTDG